MTDRDDRTVDHNIEDTLSTKAEEELDFDLADDEVDIFLQDVNDHLRAMEAGILKLEKGADAETLNAVFRAAHTLKAVAATVGHHQMTTLTHAVETLFDGMREGMIDPTPVVADVLLVSVDALIALRDEVVNREPSGIDVDKVLQRLDAMIEGAVPFVPNGQMDHPAEALPQQPGPRQVVPLDTLIVSHTLRDDQKVQAQALHNEGYALFEINVTVDEDTFAPSARLLQANMALMEIGEVVAQVPSQTDVASDQHEGYLWLVLATRADQVTLEALLEDIYDLAEYHVSPFNFEHGAETSQLTASETSAPARVPVGRIDNNTVRISVERLDTLMNLVGELVTDRTRLVRVASMLEDRFGKGETVGALDEMIAHFNRVVDQLQEEIMLARMLPIAQLFDRLPRLVRDVARTAGKQVDLRIEGEATELDRSIIEAIGDPLVHLLRNAVGHGIEPPAERVAIGKSPTGVVKLTAAHAEGHIVITVQDDGRGIDPAHVRQAAVRRGLISEEDAAQLDKEKAISLIFLPNMSTVEHVTDVSGRGVGMDVVQTNIKHLGGSVAVESDVGQGTTFRITLPLTLAILQTMLVSLGNDTYAIPLTSIVESLYFEDVKVSHVKGNPATQWRGQALPLIELPEFFAHPRRAEIAAEEAKPAIVVVAWGKLRVGLIVDKLIGKQEIVVKSLSPIIGNVPGLSGCTILGDGRVALIVDIPGLVSTLSLRHRVSVPSEKLPGQFSIRQVH